MDSSPLTRCTLMLLEHSRRLLVYSRRKRISDCFPPHSASTPPLSLLARPPLFLPALLPNNATDGTRCKQVSHGQPRIMTAPTRNTAVALIIAISPALVCTELRGPIGCARTRHKTSFSRSTIPYTVLRKMAEGKKAKVSFAYSTPWQRRQLPTHAEQLLHKRPHRNCTSRPNHG